MNNQELELRIKEILEEENFFDMIEKVKNFEKEYKTSEFYKNTKMPIMDVIKNAKAWYLINLDELFKTLQEKINNLDLTKLSELMEQAGALFATENEEIMSMMNEVKNIKFN